jgi:sulfide dehydrogenase cytochrome subunit
MSRIPLLLMLLMAGNTWAQSLEPAPAANSHARSLAATCFTCHGTDGRSVGGVPPSLAGQNRDYLLKQLQEFRDGKRPATIMHQHAKGYTDEQLKLIADYFAAVLPGQAAAAPKVK